MKLLLYQFLLLSPLTQPFTSRPSFLNSPPQIKQCNPSIHRRHHLPTPLHLIEPSGKDQLEKLTSSPSSSTSSPKLIQKTPPSLLKLASLTSIPLSFTLGLIFTPSRRLLAHAVGGLTTAALGTVTKSRLDDLTSSAAKPAIAKLILERGLEGDVSGLTEDIAKIQKDYGVTDDDFRVYRVDIYGLYLLGMCSNPITKTSELKELSNLKEALSLTNLDVGESHATAAEELYRQIGLYTPEEDLDDEGHPDRMKIEKLLFLSERAFRRGGETDEAFAFEMKRVSRALKVPSLDEALERVSEVAEPFYKRALGSTRAKLSEGKVTADMLARARESLGVSPARMADMHSECYAEEVSSLLEEGGGSGFPSGAGERLGLLQTVLEMSDEDAAYERSVECTPLFQSRLQAALDGVLEDSSAAAESWAIVERARSDLYLTKDAAAPLIDGAVVQILGGPLEAAREKMNAGNNAAAVSELEDGLVRKDAILGLLEVGGTDGDMAAKRYFDPASESSANGFVEPGERQRLYRSLLSEYLKKGGNTLTEDNISVLKNAAVYLGLSDYDTSEASRATCGPMVEKALKGAALEITGDDYTDALAKNLKEQVDKLIADLGVSEELVQEYGMNIFRDSLKMTALKCPSGIPTSDQKTQLSALASLLSLPPEKTTHFYTQTFGKVYKKSVLESMGSTGIIQPEYRAALVTLRERLGIPEEDEKGLFLSAAGEKLRPMVQLLGNEMERTMLTRDQLSQKRGVDMGQDVFKGGATSTSTTGLGIYQQDTLTSDTLILIDFYKENDLIQTTTDSETNATTTTYPITAMSLSAIEPEMAEALYRQFVVSGFASQDTEKQTRIEEDSPVFGGILGLKPEHQESIRQSIAGLIYENFIKNALRTKPSLDQQDMMFLANVQMKLDVSSEKSESLMMDAQKKILKDDAGVLFDQGLTAPSVKAFREKCANMGLDPLSDVGLTKDRVENMFKMEVGSAVESGEVTLEDTSLLREIQEGLGMDVDDAEKALERLVAGVCQNALDKINRELMRGREESCVGEIERMILFLKLVGGDVGGSGEEGEGGLSLPEVDINKKILKVYRNAEGEGKDEGEELLKAVLNLE